MESERIQCWIYRDQSIQENLSRDVVIIYNLENSLSVTVNGKTSCLKENDVIVINMNSNYVCDCSDGLYVKYALNAVDLKSCLSGKKYTFVCDSSLELNENYNGLRKVLSEILIVKYYKHKFGQIKLRQLFYDLILYLLRDFAVEQLELENSEKDELEQFVENHYFEDLSLQEISAAFNMSGQYFSKYFKKHVGVQYLKYLTDVRLSHALNDVLYTNKRFLAIAMDNGFPNISAFNHYFKEKYGVSPKSYREKNAFQSQNGHENSAELAEAIEHLRVRPETCENVISLEVDAREKKKYISFWNKVVNFGESRQLDEARILNQLKEVQNQLKFEFIRITLEKHTVNINGDYNLVKEISRFDELYRLGFKIWLTADYRDIDDIDGFCSYLKAFLSYMTRQWNIHRVREWYFELTYNTVFDQDKGDSYYEYIRKILDVLRFYGCEKNFVIGGMALGNRKGIRNLYHYLETNDLTFVNQSFVAEPYIYYEDENGMKMIRPTQENDIHNDLLTLKQTDNYFRDIVKNVFVVSWRENLQQYNILNDSCYKGALMVKKFLECFGQVDSLSPGILLDSMYDSIHQTDLMIGGDGLVTYHGIRKPSFFAYQFMNTVGNWYLNRNDNIAVFTNDYGNYHVIAHNCKNLGYRYYMEENNLDLKNLNSYFENEDPLEVRIRIDHVENGLYEIKTRSISSKGGSVQDEMERMKPGEVSFIHPHDIEFLESVSIPHISLKEVTVDSGVLDVSVILEPNEFVMIHIIHEN